MSGTTPELEMAFCEDPPPGESHTHESLDSTPLDDSDKIHELHFKKCSSVAE